MKKSNNSMVGVLRKLGLEGDNPGAFCGEWFGSGKLLKSVSPINGEVLATVRTATPEQYERVVRRAQEGFQKWQTVPAPKRGEIVRQLGNALRDAKRDLGRLITLEAGKIIAEGQGEVQEMIDICDFAVGLSRQLYGLTIASERPEHRMMDQWHRLGVVGVITPFNFPVASGSWNSALAPVCENSTGWKPSSSTTPRRIIVHESILEELTRRLQESYEQVQIGSPLDSKTLMGPLINKKSVADMQTALAAVRKQGGEILYGGEPLKGGASPGGCYVRPCLVSARHDMKI